ncbi:class III extradiol dioxygenase subunit B-like domain-containing protein [Frankia sp. AgB1.9]|uniref:class III extradiol dioxygenase subunit B-like domain-containing protein n=1 Tax=unclassified Frankia TaxID=2632575 RepID=UPI00193320E9|nr:MULTISPECIES: class III extradiol dioxygenase subunit B-like domain-containing protein [unclassified Frankia]MBL7490179.1 class III extradiol dioxygenase subunit B-like domain-containing protein [Frankia sp. AgW1.1]MBL7551894.1 class III extradiol dioxygenase subunit B-like domain-containing protein [Frankia sp. AgB1.9]MBL7624035.1 class III extradiol dioxygenase subunit B-like domain-containing protein [Frankia sp. AgB1.8]
MTLVVAAVCPHPPLLVPRVGANEPVAAREPALAAVRRLRAANPDVLVVVGDDPDALAAGFHAYSSTSVGDFRGFGVDYQVQLGPGPTAGMSDLGGVPGAVGEGGATDAPRLPLSLAVGAWLLAETGWDVARWGLGVSPKAEAAQAVARGAELVAGPDRVALLVMGDGSARRTPKAPGALDERAEPYDAVVERALATVDLDALLALDPGLSADLLVAGRASWQVLAGAVGARPIGTPTWGADVLYADAPFGVGYFVGVWEPGVSGDEGR